MQLNLRYGRGFLPVDLPESHAVTIVEPRHAPPLPDPEAALRTALAQPIGAQALRDQVRPGARVGVIFSDITRATPNQVILPVVLAELQAAGVRPGDITLFDALGTHRRNTAAELIELLGADIAAGYRIVQNDAFDATTQIRVGVSSQGHEIWLNRELLACDLKVLTGFIEPHFFAGFSGGGKAIMPGMAGQRTVLGNHDAGMIADPRATWGVTQGNPIWEEITEVAQQAGAWQGGRLFLLNVTLTGDRGITGVFAGDLEAAHAAGCAFVTETAMTPVPHPFDIVLTTNSGYPLDQNLYQTVKGMSAAALVVKPGGAIIMAAACEDGLPDHGLYGALLREASGPAALLETICQPGYLEQDQWQVQIQAQIQLKADVYVRTDGLTPAQIRAALLRPCASVEDTLAELLARYGPDATLCVLPEGPQTIPYLPAAPPATQ